MLRRTPLFILLLFISTCTASTKYNHQCNPSFCGNNTIRNPFRLKTDPKSCGLGEYELSCENNLTILYLDEDKYFVRSLNYDNFTIRIVDAGLLEGSCSSVPYSSFQCYKYERSSIYSCGGMFDFTNETGIGYISNELLSRTVAYVECAKEIESPFYAKTSSCIKSYNSSSSFFVIDGHPYIVDADNGSCFEPSCIIRLVSRTSWPRSRSYNQLSYKDIQEELVYGFEISWHKFVCKRCRNGQYCVIIRENQEYKSQCYTHYRVGAVGLWFATKMVFSEGDRRWWFETRMKLAPQAERMNVWIQMPSISSIVTWSLLTRGVGLLAVAIFLIYKWKRRHRASDENIEEFIQNQKKLLPIRYSYSNIRKIARNFKDRLGEGGYGSVYKGKLRSGQDVAVKILKNKKANGQDFINEIATIGRIHHVNVVQLIGFCVDGSKRALVYDFMPNGSLDKHIFSEEYATSLGCKEIYDIALGITRGIEYLHRGCDMQILHFDIKPHNILLDENFIPKISDFGLAKLYPPSYNIVSLTTMRGTLGYMAPELVYKTTGGVSYKADVYSFGKLLMEMACRRKNVNVTVEHSSQKYFPSWVYNQLTEGNNIEIVGIVEEEEREITKKMMIVALWCIQMNPDDRPSMHEALRMLEGFGNPPMPSKPLSYKPEVQVQISNMDTNFELTDSSSVGDSLISSINCTDRGHNIVPEISLV